MRHFASTQQLKKPKRGVAPPPPPTIRTLFALKNRKLRNRILLISLSATVVLFGCCYFYIETIQFFSYGGGAYKLKREMSKVVGDYGHQASINKQQQRELASGKQGWLSNSIIAGGGKSEPVNVPTKKPKLKQKYETWDDVESTTEEQVFPGTDEEYKKACKLMPEMMDDTTASHLPLWDEAGNPARQTYYGKDAAYVELVLKERHEEQFLEEERRAYGEA